MRSRERGQRGRAEVGPQGEGPVAFEQGAGVVRREFRMALERERRTPGVGEGAEGRERASRQDAGIRRRRTGLKRALLDQTVVSGIGNIYADEALWRARLHGERPTEKLTRAQGRSVLTAATEVMDAALAAGGTSFDALYVNVNGASGYFDRSLDAYGQADRPCRRCGTPIRRESFMNRSSSSCPRCQPRPRGL